MTRRLLHLVTLLSLLLCLGVLALWARSYWVHDQLQVCAVDHWLILHSTSGVIFVFDNHFIDSQPFRLVWMRQPQLAGPALPDVMRSMVRFGYDGSLPSSADKVLTFPHWAAAALFALLPSARFYRRLRRREDGRCKKCGYDLTGNLSGVCPECGNPSHLGVKTQP
jgi:hypothetical protein